MRSVQRLISVIVSACTLTAAAVLVAAPASAAIINTKYGAWKCTKTYQFCIRPVAVYGACINKSRDVVYGINVQENARISGYQAKFRVHHWSDAVDSDPFPLDGAEHRFTFFAGKWDTNFYYAEIVGATNGNVLSTSPKVNLDEVFINPNC